MAKLCIALDTDFEKALELVEELKTYPIIFKIGYKLFIPYGKEIIRRIKEIAPKAEIFLDLKLHDIPNTVKNGVNGAKKLNVNYLTIHTLGGKEMVKAATEEKGFLKILGVTLLTSHDENFLKELGIESSKDEFIIQLAEIGLKNNCDGLVCSAEEVSLLKEKLGNFLAVVPGIRPRGFSHDDQKRVATPREAVQKGADIIVIGRPIVKASNPKEVVEKILDEITF